MTEPDFEAIKIVNREVAKQLGFLVIQFSALDYRLSEAISYMRNDYLLESLDTQRDLILKVSAVGFEPRVQLLSKKVLQLAPHEDVADRWEEIGELLTRVNDTRNDLLHGVWRNFGAGFTGVIRQRKGEDVSTKFQTWTADRITALVMAVHYLTECIGSSLGMRQLSEARTKCGLLTIPVLEEIKDDRYEFEAIMHADKVRKFLDKVDELSDS